jgi:N-methylhydantoinase B
MMLDLDPVAVEIHRKALANVTTEMALTLARTSGSPVVTDSKDFATCILDRDGVQLAFSAYVLLHSASSWMGTVALCEELTRVGHRVRPGDGWITNDPYDGGAMHQGDVGVIMPTFHGDEHTGWAFANVHVLDVGGVGVSGFAPGAHSMFEEGLRLPLLHVIHEGELDPVWARYIEANVRAPKPVVNDIRSMIAANNVAQAKVAALIDRNGNEQFDAYCAANNDLTERLLRERIAALPDGVFEQVDFVEFDGHGGPDRLLELRCQLEVAGSELHFRFSGSPQIDGFVNATRPVIAGQTMTALLVSLGYGDLPFNGGMWRPLTFDIGPPGTIVNATPPAPVSNAHGGAGSRVCKIVKNLLAQACALSDDPVLRGRVSGQHSDGAAFAAMSGVNGRGERCVVVHMDPGIAKGGGAQSFTDGQDGYGSTTLAGCGLPDVETHEANEPVLFLWRALNQQSGGPGQFRGGQGMDQAYVVHDAEELGGHALNVCAELPPRGFGGGLPAGALAVVPTFSSNVGDLVDQGLHPTAGRVVGSHTGLERSNVGHFTLRRGDVIRTLSGGGGGIGDPLLRDPDSVASDVADGYVTPSHAAEAYGVVIAAGVVDEEATRRCRADMLRGRLGHDPDVALRAPATAGVAIVINGSNGHRHWTCGSCGAGLADVADDWRHSDKVVRRESAIAERYRELEMVVRTRVEPPDIVLREHFCRRCALCLDAGVTPVGVEAAFPAVAATPDA